MHLAELNPPQREAVLTLSGPLLVLAGAGTGKTRVITYRMAELIKNGISADRILSVTFTNKAAREMQERTQSLLGKRLRQKPMISTFHSLCVKFLRQVISHLGYPLNFVICDRGDQESAARTALRDVRIGETALKPGDLINRISRWKMAGVTSEQAKDFTDSNTDFLAAVAYRKYQANL
jgi:DNA helicase-2/ATP-dependent DNA helicase PcrA